MDMTRRSLRAYRANQPQSVSNQTPTSSSRAERATRSSLKTELPEKLIPPGSSSTEIVEESSVQTEAPTTMQTRRKRGRTEEQKDKPPRSQTSQNNTTHELDQVGEDDEVVRCICGLDEYPGPPKPDEEANSGTKETAEDSKNSVVEVAEDLAGFFLQCDVCKVWQHGGCVGIKNEGSSPEEYFCEKCRKDLHKIFTAKNGQRYSHYLPLHHGSARLASRSVLPTKDEAQSPKGTKATRPQSLQNAKRRSTMNSRDAAYDEEEQIRRAIEASKDLKTGENGEGCLRRGKRGRSDSEEKTTDLKRQRTESASPPSLEHNQVPTQLESDDGVNGRSTSNKKTRSVSLKGSKEKDQKDDKEKARLEATSKRNGRADRRRLDESELSKETSAHSKSIASHSVDSSIAPLIESLESPTISCVKVSDNTQASQLSVTSKKGGRPVNPRKGKTGKNQHIKERDKTDHDEQPSYRSQSRDVLKADDTLQNHSNRGFSSEPRAGKLKGNTCKLSMSEMKKRVAGILDFISRTQLEMASESMYRTTQDSIRDSAHGLSDSPSVSQSRSNKKDNTEAISHDGEDQFTSKEFRDLSCRDMMDVLTKQLIKWQKEFL